MELVEATRRTSKNGKTVIMRPTFLMDDSFYPNGHDHTKTKEWAVIMFDDKDADGIPDPLTNDGNNEEKVSKARSKMKKAQKTHFWFDKFEDADKKYCELTQEHGYFK